MQNVSQAMLRRHRCLMTPAHLHPPPTQNTHPFCVVPPPLVVPASLIVTAEGSLDNFYRDLAWALLGVGQRSLALLASRARYKVAPSARAAGEVCGWSESCPVHHVM
jgi:hypothetical protein